jgi:hypothetical protein
MSTRRKLTRVVLPLLAIVASWIVVASAQAEFKVTEFSNVALDAEGHLDSRAGDHPFEIVSNQEFSELPGVAAPTENLRDMRVDLPVGFAGNVKAIPQCTDALLDLESCPINTVVGSIELRQGTGTTRQFILTVPLYNLTPSPNEPALFGFSSLYFPVRSHVLVRTDSDYGVSYELQNIPQPTALVGVTTRLWGVPGDPRHDAERGATCFDNEIFPRECFFYGGGPGPSGLEPVPFFTNGTRCGVATSAKITVDSWQNKGVFDSKEAETPPLTGCDEVEFDPGLKARPTTNAADSPSGLDVDLKMPQNEAPEGLGTSNLRNVQVTLPEGLVVNPSSANGLGACSPAQIGMTTAVGDPDAHFDLATAACPDASRIGGAEIKVPSFADPLKGGVFLASPHQNPFGSLLALYLVVEGHGLKIKLPGKITADPRTGRLVSSFEENPQQPVEELKLNLFAGGAAEDAGELRHLLDHFGLDAVFGAGIRSARHSVGHLRNQPGSQRRGLRRPAQQPQLRSGLDGAPGR